MTSTPHIRARTLGAVGPTLLLLAGCLLVPDDREKGTQVVNLRPSVRITGGAATPDPSGIDYKVQFYWSGSDVDGRVLRYEWAVDDTVTETAWRDTTGFSARFLFTARTQMPGSAVHFTDWHTFYIRAIDNENAVSLPDKRFFNARTIAPTSRITFPDLRAQGSNASLQRTTNIRWDGQDLDSSRPDQRPVAYEYKLVRLPEGTFPSPDSSIYRSFLISGINELSTLPGEARRRWIRVPEETRSITLRDLPPTQAFVFGVRAVDEAGAIEPELVLNRNYLAFQVSSTISKPDVTVSEERLGSHRFPRDGDVWSIEVPSNVNLDFRWVGDASFYGSEPGNSNYALDIPDPDDESIRNDRGIGGWIGWGRWSGTQTPIRFTEDQAGTVHFLYLKMRDISDTRASERQCILRLTVVGFSFARFALVVDDARFQVTVNDAMHDAFINNVFLRRLHEMRGQYGQIDQASIFFGPTETGNPAVISLAEMAVYRHILWSCEPSSARSGIDSGQNGGKDNNEQALISYITAGGRFFVFGGRIVGMNTGGFGYPFLPVSSNTDERSKMLYWRFFYAHSYIVSSGCRADPLCEGCYSRIASMVAARSVDPAFPDLMLDPAKWDPYQPGESDYRGGIQSYEGFYTPPTQDPERWDGLDSLYVLETWDRSVIPACNTRSQISGSPCALRYESTRVDTLLNRQHGRVMVMDFQPYYFLAEQVASAGTAAVNWLVTGRDQ